MTWLRVLRRPPGAEFDNWWREADAAAASPTVEAIDRLVQAIPPGATAPDEAERQLEMTEGLERLRAAAAHRELPVVATQHRVIGSDVCHFVSPASLVAETASTGKLFVTSRRLIFSGGAVTALPWHRVRALVRAGRDLVVTVSGSTVLQVRCNTYGDALVAGHLAERARERA